MKYRRKKTSSEAVAAVALATVVITKPRTDKTLKAIVTNSAERRNESWLWRLFSNFRNLKYRRKRTSLEAVAAVALAAVVMAGPRTDKSYTVPSTLSGSRSYDNVPRGLLPEALAALKRSSLFYFE